MPRAIYNLFDRVPNTYVLLVGLFGVVMALTLVGFYVVGQTTPNVIQSDYAAIASTRKMKRAMAGLRHPEDYPPRPYQEYVTQFDLGLKAARVDADIPDQVIIINAVEKQWNLLRKDPQHITIAQFRAISESLDAFITSNEQEMVDRLTRQERIRTIVSWCGIPFFLLAWFV
jgi:hypothetical protein